MGMLHSAIIRALPNAEVCAIVEPQLPLRFFAPRLVPGARLYRALDRMLVRESPDAVYVTTPTGSHPGLCEAVLASGSALFVEKPLAASAALARRTQELAEKQRATTMVGYVKRFTATYREARSMLAAGAIGAPRTFAASVLVDQVRSRGRGWRFRGGGGGGALSVLGCHLVDTVRWFFGDIEWSSGNAVRIYSDEVEDEFTAGVRTVSGAEGRIEVSWSRPGYRIPETRIAVEGEEGSLVVTDDYVRLEAHGRSVDTRYKQDLIGGVAIDVGGPEFTVESGAFVDAVRASTATECTVAEGYRTQLAIDALYGSAERLARAPVA
jgi:predicted dehydrogenase